jgi:4,5:9,10-diseco-3-hydroxy-5,9,17-trioxoandrosta-1(10),2-diene-4-oate hydrolase
MVEEQNIDVGGLPVRYLTAGEGPPLVLLHALGESALDWRWVLPGLSSTHRVYAPDLPGFGGSSSEPVDDYSPSFFARFVLAFLDVLEVERAVVAGNSLGGLVALRLALSEPSRVEALGLIDSAGLGQEVSYALRQPTLPGQGELAAILGKTPLGAATRTWLRVPLLFARPERVPVEWFEEQQRLTQLPGFLEAVIAALRAQVTLEGQREVLLDQLPQLQMPTLIVWGASDLIFPKSQAQEAVARLKQGSLEVIPDCGHLPHIEQPEHFVVVLGQFLENQASR